MGHEVDPGGIVAPADLLVRCSDRLAARAALSRAQSPLREDDGLVVGRGEGDQPIQPVSLREHVPELVLGPRVRLLFIVVDVESDLVHVVVARVVPGKVADALITAGGVPLEGEVRAGHRAHRGDDVVEVPDEGGRASLCRPGEVIAVELPPDPDDGGREARLDDVRADGAEVVVEVAGRPLRQPVTTSAGLRRLGIRRIRVGQHVDAPDHRVAVALPLRVWPMRLRHGVPGRPADEIHGESWLGAERGGEGRHRRRIGRAGVDAEDPIGGGCGCPCSDSRRPRRRPHEGKDRGEHEPGDAPPPQHAVVPSPWSSPAMSIRVQLHQQFPPPIPALDTDWQTAPPEARQGAVRPSERADRFGHESAAHELHAETDGSHNRHFRC